jgi:hypothetical protein
MLHAGFFPRLFFDPEDGGDIFLSETSVDFQRTARRYIPEDSTLQDKTVLVMNQKSIRDEAVMTNVKVLS